MNKNRIVSCTVNNYTDYALTYITDTYENGESGDSHGSWVQKPVSSIPAGGTAKPAFEVERSSAFSTVGSTGWVAYDLNNGQGQIVFMFNNPNNYDGAGSSSNCWFYAAIQGCAPTGLGVGLPVGTPLNVYATVSGLNFNVTDPTNEDTMDIEVNVYNASALNSTS